MFDMLSYIPTNKMQTRFLNKLDVLTVERLSTATPEQFQDKVHAELKKIFNHYSSGGTPLLSSLKKVLNQTEKTMHYIYTDGSPSDATIDDFIAEREEVLKDQGPSFPFAHGFWLLCQLCAAINPDDLDALDESVPFNASLG